MGAFSKRRIPLPPDFCSCLRIMRAGMGGGWAALLPLPAPLEEAAAVGWELLLLVVPPDDVDAPKTAEDKKDEEEEEEEVEGERGAVALIALILAPMAVLLLGGDTAV